MKVTLLVMTLDEIDGMKAIMPSIKKRLGGPNSCVDGGSYGRVYRMGREWLSGYIQKRGFRHAYTEVCH